MQYDPKLGKEIHEHLRKLKLETPMFVRSPAIDQHEAIRDSFEIIMRTLGLDVHDDSMIKTPHRVAKMYCQEIFYGLNYDNFPACTTVENKMGYEEMITGKASVLSTCEHHF